MASTFTLSGVTPAQLTKLEAQLAANGETLTMNSPTQCTIQGHHIDATGVYDPASRVLTVTVQSKPFYITEDAIHEGLQKALRAPI